jgi:hypothetical protein
MGARVKEAIQEAIDAAAAMDTCVRNVDRVSRQITALVKGITKLFALF